MLVSLCRKACIFEYYHSLEDHIALPTISTELQAEYECYNLHSSTVKLTDPPQQGTVLLESCNATVVEQPCSNIYNNCNIAESQSNTPAKSHNEGILQEVPEESCHDKEPLRNHTLLQGMPVAHNSGHHFILTSDQPSNVDHTEEMSSKYVLHHYTVCPCILCFAFQ